MSPLLSKHPEIRPDPPRLLKFGSLYPMVSLRQNIERDRSIIEKMSYEEYYQWMMGLKIWSYDCFTYPMREAGWDAREVIACEPIFMEKLEKDLLGISRFRGALSTIQHAFKNLPLPDLLTPHPGKWFHETRMKWQIEKYIDSFKPHIIFMHEPTYLGNRLFRKYSDRSLRVAMAGTLLRNLGDWRLDGFDAFICFSPLVKDFMEDQKIPAILSSFGLDERSSDSAIDCPKEHSVTFIGQLLTDEQSRKRQLIHTIADRIPSFKWWGLLPNESSQTAALLRSYQGNAAGSQLLDIYKKSHIVINDFPDRTHGYNFRIKEILASGSMMLTRYSSAVEPLLQAKVAVAFHTDDECCQLIETYLKRPEDCARIGHQGRMYGLEQFGYRKVVGELMTFLSTCYENKFGKPLNVGNAQ